MSVNWVEHVMWWHVYPLGFVGAPIRPESREGHGARRLPMVEQWFDHILDLGLNGLALGPVFSSMSHGYDTLDYFAVDDRLGDEADLVQLVKAAHERGIRVLLDGVFNHVGRAHPWFADVERSGPQSPYAGLFRIDWTGWSPGEPVKADVFEGHDGLVALDHSSPRVVDLVVEVMNYWLARGVDGWRLDAAYAVPPSFWAEVLPRVREQHPDAWFTGEVIHGADVQKVEASTMDSLTQYELWQGIWHGISDRNLHELGHALKRHSLLLSGYVPSTFVGNHDVTRIASAVGPEHVGHALAVLFTVAGVPSVYAGDEYGWKAVKEDRFGGDDAVRPEFPATPPAEDSLGSEAAGILHEHRELAGLRRRNPWLYRASTDVVTAANETLVFRTAVSSSEALVTVLNLGPAPYRVNGAGATAVAAGTAARDGSGFIVPANGWAVLA